jgi:hypothetical protein
MSVEQSKVSVSMQSSKISMSMDLSDTMVSKRSENDKSNMESYEGGVEVEPLSSSVLFLVGRGDVY